jgi:hypothetical protein
MGSKILFMNLKDDISSALEKLGIDYIEELKIPVSTVNNNRKQQQQQPEPTGNNNNKNNNNGN